MLSKIKHHPFAIQAYFDYSIVLSYAVPKEDVEHLLPPFLSLDLYDNRFAFFTLAAVKVSDLRLKGLARFLGQDFYLIGHRIFVQYNNVAGKRLRGLYILKSETDSLQMKLIGNAMTQYKYEKTVISSSIKGEAISIYKGDNELIKVKKGKETSPLPAESVFDNWQQARRFAGPLPFTFSALKDKSEVLIVQGNRANWKPVPLEIETLSLDLSMYSFLKNARLSNAFIVEDIDYEWQKGTIEKRKR